MQVLKRPSFESPTGTTLLQSENGLSVSGGLDLEGDILEDLKIKAFLQFH